MLVVTPVFNMDISTNCLPSVFIQHVSGDPSSTITLTHPEIKFVVNKENFGSSPFSQKSVIIGTGNKLEESRLNVSPFPKAVKQHKKIGNGKKTGLKIFLGVLAAIFLAVTVLSIVSIPFWAEYSYNPGRLIPITIGFGVIFLGFFSRTIDSLTKVDKATAHLRKLKIKKARH